MSTVLTPAPSKPPRKRVRQAELAAALVAALLVTLVAASTADWWVDSASAERARNLPIARAALFVSTFAAAACLSTLLRLTTRTFWSYFGYWSTYLGAWLLAVWPGIVVSDTVAIYDNSRQGIVYEWFSYLYSFLNLMVLDIYPSAISFALLQLVVTAGLLAYVSQEVTTASGSRVPALLLALLGSISIPLITETLQITRDTLFGVLHVLLALLVARAVARGYLSPGRLAGIAVLTGLLSSLRGDGLVLLLAVPAALVLLRPGRRVLAAWVGVLALSVAFFHVVLPGALAVRPAGPGYDLTLVLNPLGAVLASDAAQPLDEDVERDLGRVIDVAVVRELANPVELQAYWGGHWNQNASEADWRAFNRASRQLVLEHPDVVLRNQFSTFWAASGMSAGSIMGPEHLSEHPGDRRAGSMVASDLTRELNPPPPSGAAYGAARTLLVGTTAEAGGLFGGRAWHWNLIPALLVLGACLLAPRRRTFLAVFAALILCRLPLVFVLSPVAQFKYYYSVYLGALVAVAFIVAGLRWLPVGARSAAKHGGPASEQSIAV